MLLSASAALFFVKRGIKRVKVLRVETVSNKSQRLAEALIVNDLALAKKFDGVADVGVVDHSDKVVVGDARFLLCCNYVLTTKS